MHKWKLGSGLIPIGSLMSFGGLFLFIPSLYHGLQLVPSVHVLLALFGLAILPTIGGFLCTTKSLVHLSGDKVQLVELSEPIFSSLLA